VTVETRAAATRLSQLDLAVLESVAYSDVFDFPVTAAEIHRSLAVETSQAAVEAILELNSPLAEHVTFKAPYYVLAGRDALIATRERRGRASKRLMRRAGFYGRLIGNLPFVRMVAVTGSLAVDNADDGDDIDYLIVTSPGRVWLARALTMTVVRLATLRGLTLCPNYLLAESALSLPERDAYTARELLQMRPVHGREVHARMLRANTWGRDLMPNWQVELAGEGRTGSLLGRIGERALGGRLGDAIERWLLRRKGRELNSRAGENGEAVFNETVCKGHFDAHKARLQDELRRRLQRLGVQA